MSIVPNWNKKCKKHASIYKLAVSLLKPRKTENDMLDNLDELIELNLKLLYNSPNMYMWRIDFRDEKRRKLQDSLRFAKILDKEGLIDLEPVKMYRCELTKFGRDIVIGDGWLKHLELVNKNKESELKKSDIKDTLEIELKTLQKESLEYQLTIRKQTDRIRNLEERIKIISLFKLYWWLFPILICPKELLKIFQWILI